jgi:hypothetical protein
MLVLGCTADGTCFVGTNQPLGDGAATVTVNRSGLIQMNGSLSDGAPISQKLPIAERGHWPLFVSLYGGRGLLLGWMQFEDYGGLSTVCWQKGTPPPPGQRHYLEGFSSFRVGAITRYTPPPPGHNALGWTNGTVYISVGNLPERMANDVTVLSNRISSQSGSISNLSLSVTPSNGVFRGSFYHPALKRLVSFNGVVVQLDPTYYEMYSGGWFFGTNESGNIRLHPR